MMTILNDIWEFFFPRYCVVCGRRLSQGEEQLCISCFLSLPRTRFRSNEENGVAKLLWGKMPLERAFAFLYYMKGGNVRNLLYELKYYGNRDIGRFLGRCMAAELLPSGFFEGIDCIIPVPLHDRKLKSRGYNQSELLAEGVSSIVRIPVFGGALRRKQYTDTQTHKNNYERWANVNEVFECVSDGDLSNKHILLLDDVLTTGATLVACADALKEVPGLQISVLALAWAAES